MVYLKLLRQSMENSGRMAGSRTGIRTDASRIQVKSTVIVQTRSVLQTDSNNSVVILCKISKEG